MGSLSIRDAPISNNSPVTMATLPPSSGGKSLLICGSIFAVLCTIWMVLRMYSRKVRNTCIYAEDWLVLAALIFYYALLVNIFYLVIAAGLGHHDVDIPPHMIITLIKFSIPLNTLFTLSLGLVKCSICLTLSRIFFMPPYKQLALLSLLLAIFWTTAAIIVIFATCRPVSALWNPLTPGAVCSDTNRAIFATNCADIVLDALIVVLPLPVIIRLQVPRANKIALVFLFALGLITIGAGVLRAVALAKLQTDIAFDMVAPELFCVCQVGIAIFIANSTVIRPVFDRIFGRWRCASENTCPRYPVSKSSDPDARLPAGQV
ncbi:hypothetical protein BT63DRAFT_74773 [Microthyrium microscopicum]|uniref:Rhodopsin domain-containing protein n=1 Tax=Microthyrium microscopicum TaxID=703497 RepID=A0A6A6U1G5_9PEZI|nr:hypothetical protein BT63DRAFT_74773 [Microthyrium microscopicum]